MSLPRREFLRFTGVLAGSLMSGGSRLVAAAVPAAGDHAAWRAAARRLLEPLAALMVPGQASLPLAGEASEYGGPQADRLESLVRPLMLAAHWLQLPPDPADAELHARVAAWCRQAIVIGSDPAHPQYFGPDANYHQLHVEIGLLCIGLQLAPAALWDPLSEAEKDQFATWLGTARGNGIVNNNHYFMGIHILEFLGDKGYGRPADRIVIDEFFRRMEFMHRGGGWFEDGVNQAFDHYNAFAFHFYGLMWTRLYGRLEPARAARWRDWARQFVADYQHFFAASGEHPAFGRSLTYRFNTINVFGMALAEGCCDLPPGRLRRLCTRNLNFFLSRPIYQSQGCLALGWTDEFPALAEKYSCAASPYWAAKGLAPLLLPPDHPFWTAPEEPLPSERGDHAHVIRPAGLVVRSIAGAVEILNAGSQVSQSNRRYGPWKWSKTAYRTGVSFTLAFPNETNWSPDSALIVQTDSGAVFGRHSTVALATEPDHLRYVTNFGGTLRQYNVGIEAGVWWRAGWLLQVHACDARQPVIFRLGGYALPLATPEVSLAAAGSVASAWAPDGRGSVLQVVHGLPEVQLEHRLDDHEPRRHIAAPYHATPLASTPRQQGPAILVALTWTGSDRAEAAPWVIRSLTAGQWQLDHPHLGPWVIKHPALPALPPA